jgi:gliding motility-associated-like protein
MNFKILYILPIFCFHSVFSQILITDADFTGPNSCNCNPTFSDGTVTNFFDSGGDLNDYSANEDESITFCPDATGSKVGLLFGTNVGFVWNVHSTDTVYIYDGPTTASPLLVKGNSDSHPAGFPAGLTRASWANTSGCLTVQFKSDASNQAQGWAANVSCGNYTQPFQIGMQALIGAGEANGAGDQIDDMTNQSITAPLPDTGYVNVCLGDSILFISKPVFPYEPGGSMAPTSGGGYVQTGNFTSLWEFSDGTSHVGDSVWFVPTARTGYFIQLRVTEPMGLFDIIMSKVRVSTIPSFETCRPLDDEICVGQVTTLIGGITQSDTAGVAAVSSAFQIQGSFAAQTYLPDGSGQNYTTDINIAGFPAGMTLQNLGDLESICVDIEHSYLGDLEMMLTCPNGQSVNVFNAFTGNGLFPGGFGGGGTFLGGANDTGPNGVPGICETYCFSENPGALPAWVNGYNTVPTSFPAGCGFGTCLMVEPGTYNPEQSYIAALSGCPLNGTWTLTVRDNLLSDDGFICEWGIYFDAALNPNNETYTPVIVSEQWLSDPTILTGTSDTAVIVAPNVVGNYNYTFQVTDNYGCSYDTVVTVLVKPGPSIAPGDTTCNDFFTFTNTFAPSEGGVSGGTWSYTGPGNLEITTSPTGPPTTTFINPTITPSVNGTYDVSFTDNVCNYTVTSSFTFLDDPIAFIFGEDTICKGDTAKLFTILKEGESAVWLNPNGVIISTDTNALGIISGEYYVIVTNVCSSDEASMNVLIEPCEVPNVITPNGDGVNDFFYTRYADNYSDVNLTIFNRWGRVVYQTDAYDNTWGGEKTNGNEINGGVYYYIMTWDGGTKDQNGNITVFK